MDNLKRALVLLQMTIAAGLAVYSQDTILYKQIDTISLFLEVYMPESVSSTEKSGPGIVFFFGGGWKRWNEGSFQTSCRVFF